MARKKKDGRHINYYIDRQIYERLEQYADDKGQQMTTAIERILKEHLDHYEAEELKKGGGRMYCQTCNILAESIRCPVCGNGKLRAPQPEDYCFLAEKDVLWAGTLSEVLENNAIPFVTKNVLGAGMTAKLGMGSEQVRFYVPYEFWEQAKKLEQDIFPESV